jgi:hypothetical protein
MQCNNLYNLDAIIVGNNVEWYGSGWPSSGSDPVAVLFLYEVHFLTVLGMAKS